MPKKINLTLEVTCTRVNAADNTVESKYGPLPFTYNGLSMVDAAEIEAMLVTAVSGYVEQLLAKGKKHAEASTVAGK